MLASRLQITAKQLRKVADTEERQEQLDFAQQQKRDDFQQTLLQAGFESIEQAQKVAKQYKEKHKHHEKLSGDLKHKWQRRREIAKQLPTGTVAITGLQPGRQLGRMRALVRLVALENGYRVVFAKDELGQERFTLTTQHPLMEDDYGEVYTVQVKPYTDPRVLAFYKLPQSIKKRLLQSV